VTLSCKKGEIMRKPAKVLILTIPVAFLAPPQMTEAATVTVNVTASSSTNCTYSSIATDALGNVTVTCSGSPSPPVTSPPVTSPPVTSPPVTSPPVTSPPVTSPPPNCPALPTGYTGTIIEPGQNTGQFLFDNPGSYERVSTNTGKISVFPFISSAGFSTKTTTADNNGSNARKDVSISTCAGDFSTSLPAACLSTLRYAATVTMSTTDTTGSYCKIDVNKQYYVNIKGSTPSAAISYDFWFR
jgi:hypothetical protein